MRTAMRATRSFYFALQAALLVWLRGAVGNNYAESKTQTQTNKGEIVGIDLIHEIVVVDVPIAGGHLMTIGGAVVEDTRLNKGNRSVDLANFSEGEAVTVKWRSTDDGHDILGLQSR
jgi:hypothetical protein